MVLSELFMQKFRYLTMQHRGPQPQGRGLVAVTCLELGRTSSMQAHAGPFVRAVGVHTSVCSSIYGVLGFCSIIVLIRIMLSPFVRD